MRQEIVVEHPVLSDRLHEPPASYLRDGRVDERRLSFGTRPLRHHGEVGRRLRKRIRNDGRGALEPKQIGELRREKSTRQHVGDLLRERRRHAAPHAVHFQGVGEDAEGRGVRSARRRDERPCVRRVPRSHRGEDRRRVRRIDHVGRQGHHGAPTTVSRRRARRRARRRLFPFARTGARLFAARAPLRAPRVSSPRPRSSSRACRSRRERTCALTRRR